MQEKISSGCGLSKPLSDFYKDCRVKDGKYQSFENYATAKQQKHIEKKIQKFIVKQV